MEKHKLKATTEAIKVLDHIGSISPPTLALFFQLLNSGTGSLLKSEIRLRQGVDKAVKLLASHGIVEVSKDIIQCVYLIDSEVVHSEKKARRKKEPVADWESMLREKGGNVDGVNSLITGTSKAAAFYRNELAANYVKGDDTFDAYKKFVAMLWKGNLESPMTKVLAMPVQLSYNRFKSGNFSRQKTDTLIDILRNLEAAVKDYTDVGLVIHNWLKGRNRV